MGSIVVLIYISINCVYVCVLLGIMTLCVCVCVSRNQTILLEQEIFRVHFQGRSVFHIKFFAAFNFRRYSSDQ